MQLSASSSLLDLLAAPPAASAGQPAPTTTALSADGAAVAGNFGALLSAQTKPATASSAAAENPPGVATVSPSASNAAGATVGQGSLTPLDAASTSAPGTVLPGPSDLVSAESARLSKRSASPTAGASTAGATMRAMQISAAPAARTPRSPAAATPTPDATGTSDIVSASGEVSSNSPELVEVGAQLTGEITAAWLAANGSTVVVAAPAGELIAVDVSLRTEDLSGDPLSGIGVTDLATGTTAGPVKPGAGTAAATSLAGNSPVALEQMPPRGAMAVANFARSRLGSATAAPTETESSDARDESNPQPATTPGLTQSRPTITAPGATASIAVTVSTGARSAPNSVSSAVAPSSAPVAPVPEIPSQGAPVPVLLPTAQQLSASFDDAAQNGSTKDLSLDASRTATARAAAGATSSVALLNRAAEKIAGELGGETSVLSVTRGGKLKNILAASGEQLTESSSGLGINAAESRARMPALAHPTPSLFAENDPLSFPSVPLTFDTLVQDAQEQMANPFTSSARRAVDSAMAVVEHFSKGTQRGVNLQFSVSGLDLAVRVEMRPDGVHTIFRTDSPELRNALAQEWQSVVNTPAADRPQRLAEPVFTSTSAGGPTSGEQGASHQRESGTPQSQWEKATAFAPPALSRTTTETPLAVASNGPRLAPQGTARHLSAVA